MSNNPIQLATRFSEASNVLPRVEIFSAGLHRGKSYTRSDLDDIIAAFNRYSIGTNGKPATRQGRLNVPVVLGHDEADEQSLLQQKGIPAAAWVELIWREDDILLARLVDVHPKVMRLIVGRRYRTVSSEIYDLHPAGLASAGTKKKMLRRVAFLGGEIPQIKTLEDIPIPHSESGDSRLWFPVTLEPGKLLRRAESGSYVAFSEVRPMTPEEVLNKLRECGLNTDAMANVKPQAIAEVLRVVSDLRDQVTQANAAQEQQSKEPKMPDDMTVTPVEEKTPDPAQENPDEVQPEEGAPPQKFAAYHKAKYRKYASMCKMSDDPDSDDDEKTDDNDPEMKKFSERYAKAEKRLAAIETTSRLRLLAEKKARIKGEVDSLVAQGRVSPAERKTGLDDSLYALDAERVEKFSDGLKVVSLTPLDNALRILHARPVLMRFGEHIPSSGKDGAGDDVEVEKIEAHYDRFSEQFERNKLPKESLVAGFKAERSRKPKMTADEYLNV